MHDALLATQDQARQNERSLAGLLLLALSAFAPCARAQTSSTWRRSAWSLAAAATFDAASSWRLPEQNRLLRDSQGVFAFRGVGVKTGLTAGLLAAQYFWLRRHPEHARWLAVMNFGAVGVTATAGAMNLRCRAGVP